MYIFAHIERGNILVYSIHLRSRFCQIDTYSTCKRPETNFLDKRNKSKRLTETKGWDRYGACCSTGKWGWRSCRCGHCSAGLAGPAQLKRLSCLRLSKPSPILPSNWKFFTSHIFQPTHFAKSRPSQVSWCWWKWSMSLTWCCCWPSEARNDPVQWRQKRRISRRPIRRDKMWSPGPNRCGPPLLGRRPTDQPHHFLVDQKDNIYIMHKWTLFWHMFAVYLCNQLHKWPAGTGRSFPPSFHSASSHSSLAVPSWGHQHKQDCRHPNPLGDLLDPWRDTSGCTRHSHHWTSAATLCHAPSRPGWCRMIQVSLESKVQWLKGL